MNLRLKVHNLLITCNLTFFWKRAVAILLTQVTGISV